MNSPRNESQTSAPWRLAHLAVLWAFAIVQPLLDLLGRNAEFFVARGNASADIVTFALLLTILPPLAMVAIEAVVGLVSSAAARALHLVFVGLLAAGFFLQLLDGVIDVGSWPLVAGALALGALCALAYRDQEAVRSLLGFLVPAPAVFVILFLFASDVSKVVFPEEEAAALTAEAGDRPVLMVIFDELPSASLMEPGGDINDHRFPSFAALAEDATWYRNATTVATHTVAAVPAILDGKLPDPSLQPILADHPDNLFTLLGGSGQLNVHQESSQLCPVDSCETDSGSFGDRLSSLVSDLSVVSGRLLLPDSLASDLPRVNQGFSGFGAGESSSVMPRDLPRNGTNPSAVTGLLEGIERDPRGLHFIHLMLPHVPWRYLPTGQDYGDGEVWAEWSDVGDERWGPDVGATERGLRAHLLQLGYADLLLGRIMEAARSAGIWEEATVVVVSDHGGSFNAGALRRQLEPETWGAITSMPLLIKAPDQRRGRIDDSPVRTIDILPTIADLLEIDLPFEVDGVPANSVKPVQEISVLNAEDEEPQAFSLEETLAQRDQIVARIAQLFGTDWDGVYRHGPAPELLGAHVGSLELFDSGQDASITLTDAENYEDVELTSRFVPALVSGAVTGIPVGAPLAIAVNGRIAATAEVYESILDDSTPQFAAMVPPESFKRGTNDVTVYEVASGGGEPALRSLGP